MLNQKFFVGIWGCNDSFIIDIDDLPRMAIWFALDVFASGVVNFD